jgi:hypothetical protein
VGDLEDGEVALAVPQLDRVLCVLAEGDDRLETRELRYRTVTDVLPSLYVRRLNYYLAVNRSKWG